MKVKVIEKFKDKYLKENGKPVVHKVNDILDITEERFAEILTVGKFVEKIEEPKENTAKKKTTKKTAK